MVVEKNHMKKNESEFICALRKAGFSRALCEGVNGIRKAIFEAEEGSVEYVEYNGETKYKFTGEIMTWNGHKLYRIRALKRIEFVLDGKTIVVKEGDLGGWVEKKKNLSQEGDCWVHKNAKVYGEDGEDAIVRGDALVSDDAEVYGKAVVRGNAYVHGHAKVYGEAMVYDEARVYDEAQVYDHAEVYGIAKIHGKAKVHGEEVEVFDKAEVFGNASEVFGKAKVYGEKTKVSGEAKVSGRAQVFGDARVFGNAQVFGKAKVHGEKTEVFGRAQVGGKADVHGGSKICGSAQVDYEVSKGIVRYPLTLVLDDIRIGYRTTEQVKLDPFSVPADEVLADSDRPVGKRLNHLLHNLIGSTFTDTLDMREAIIDALKPYEIDDDDFSDYDGHTSAIVFLDNDTEMEGGSICVTLEFYWHKTQKPTKIP